MQHYSAARRPQQIHVRTAREETESEPLERALKASRKLAGRRAAAAELDEGMGLIELVHIRVLFGFRFRADWDTR
jgi:hypothetical protein